MTDQKMELVVADGVHKKKSAILAIPAEVCASACDKKGIWFLNFYQFLNCFGERVVIKVGILLIHDRFVTDPCPTYCIFWFLAFFCHVLFWDEAF